MTKSITFAHPFALFFADNDAEECLLCYKPQDVLGVGESTIYDNLKIDQCYPNIRPFQKYRTYDPPLQTRKRWLLVLAMLVFFRQNKYDG